MNFTLEELAALNRIISVALLSGKVEFDEITESIHTKVTDEICRVTASWRQVEDA